MQKHWEYPIFSLLFSTSIRKQGVILYCGLAIDRILAAAELNPHTMSALVSIASRARLPVTLQQPLTEMTVK